MLDRFFVNTPVFTSRRRRGVRVGRRLRVWGNRASSCIRRYALIRMRKTYLFRTGFVPLFRL